MFNIDTIMNDVEDAVNVALEGSQSDVFRRSRVEDITAKVRALVVPAFDEQENVISKRDMEIMQYIGKVEEQAEMIDEYKYDEREREVEAERADAIRMFNEAANGEQVYFTV